MCCSSRVSLRMGRISGLTYRSAWADGDVRHKWLSHSMRCASAGGASSSSAGHASRTTEHCAACCAWCAVLTRL